MVSVGFFKRFSTSASASASSDWKTQLSLSRLVSDISCILLQRRNWISHVQSVKSRFPSSTLTPPLFLQIVNKTRKCPKTTLDFFDWGKIHLRFEPDVKSHCKVIEIAAESGQLERAEILLRPLVETHLVPNVVESMHRWFESEVSLSISLSLVMEFYALKGCCNDGLEVFVSMRRLGLSPSLQAYNSLLHALVKGTHFRLAWCLYTAMVRNQVLPDGLTWDLIAQILCEQGKSRTVVKMVESGVESGKIYANLIECYSRNGEFNVVFSLIHEMNGKKLDLSFGSYSCILDDACRLGDEEAIHKVLALMAEEKLLANHLMIERLCNMGKTFASEMLFHKACNGTARLQDWTYRCMLNSLSKQGRVKEAVDVYRSICRKGITVDESCYNEFTNALCREDSSEEEQRLLVDVIKRGFIPSAHKLSELVGSLCQQRRWKQAEEFLDLILEMDVCLDSFSCRLLMERYCRSRKLEKAMKLHEKIKKMKGSLDVNAYNAVLDQLMRKRKMVEDAIGVFEYMKEVKSVNSKSFMIMIRGLCHVKEMKKAMKSHDEMLKLGMKPDLATYKRLISGFK